MSYMNRSEGLVQRRNVAQLSTSSKGTDDMDEEKRFEKEEDEDSKETRFTLLEEVLLLGLKDREVLHFCLIHTF